MMPHVSASINSFLALKSYATTKLFFLKMGHSWPLFLYFCLFYCAIGRYTFADVRIQSADLWCQKRPLYQLSHNHCP